MEAWYPGFSGMMIPNHSRPFLATLHDKGVAMQYIERMGLRFTNDFIFRYVLGREEAKPLLLDLVNAVLEDAGCLPIISLDLAQSRESPGRILGQGNCAGHQGRGARQATVRH